MNVFFKPNMFYAIFILVITTVVYANMFRNGFTVDDHVFVGSYHPSIGEAFRGSVPRGHDGVYRPIRGILYNVYFHLFGVNPYGYHLHALIIHLTTTILVFLIAGSMVRLGYMKPIGSLLTALFFGLHPVHTEAITYIASSMDETGVVFMLTSLLCYLTIGTRQSLQKKHRYLLSFISITSAFLAYFTYEMTLTLPLLLLLYEYTLDQQHQTHADRLKKTFPYFLGAGMYLFVRFFLLSITSRGVYLADSLHLTALTMTRVLVQYLWVMIFPIQLVQNHSIAPGIEAFVYRGYRTAAILNQSILDPEVLFSISLIVTLLYSAVILRKKHPFITFSIGWFFIALLPVLGFVPQGSIMNERMLYVASVGFILFLSWSLSSLYRAYTQYRIHTIAGITVIMLLYAGRTIMRNQDWSDDITLWQKDVLAAPTENAYARFALGNAYFGAKRYQEAIQQYEGSTVINPGFAVGYASLWRVYRQIGNSDVSDQYYQKAAAAEPGFWEKP